MELNVDWDFKRYFKKIVNKNSLYRETDGQSHPLWKYYIYPDSNSLLEKNRHIIGKALKAEEHLLEAMGFKTEDAVSLQEDPDNDDSLSYNVQCLFNMIDKHHSWIEDAAQGSQLNIESLNLSDQALRNYVLYINWLFNWVSSMYSSDLLTAKRLEDEI